MLTLFEQSFLLNSYLLLSFMLCADFIFSRVGCDWLQKSVPFPKLISGVIVGVMSIVLMKTSVVLDDGTIFDSRSVLFAVNSFVIGPISTLSAVLVAGAYRLYLGGQGVIAGTATILVSSFVGLLWRFLIGKNHLERISWQSAYFLGFVAHVFMLLCMLIMPYDIAFHVLNVISIPVIITMPLLTMVSIQLFSNTAQRLKSTESLQQRENVLRKTQELAQVADWTFYGGEDGLTVSEEFCRLFEIEPIVEKVSFTLMRQKLHPADVDVLDQYISWQFADHSVIVTPSVEDYRIIRSNGAIRWLRPKYGETKFDKLGDLKYAAGMIQDVTEERATTQQLRLSAHVFTHAFEGVILADKNKIIIDANQAFINLTGYQHSEIIGRIPEEVGFDKSSQEIVLAIRNSLQLKSSWRGDVEIFHKDGHTIQTIVTVNAVRSSNKVIEYYVIHYSDVTETKAYEAKLERMAKYDPLTGLPNRVLLSERLYQAMEQVNNLETRLWVAFVDLDGFKEINDQYGHEVGDQFLQVVSQRMQNVLRPNDTIGRIGGDEFVAILLEPSKNDDAKLVLDSILVTAADSVIVQELPLSVTASIGVAIYSYGDATGGEQLIRQADNAMYQAKLSGKNRYHFFDRSLERSLKDHHHLVTQINRAIYNGEFSLYLQPKVDMFSGQVVGAEGLIRWNHPEDGLIMPGKFLPPIEMHPLIIEIGEWTIRTALTELGRLQENGKSISISVNIAAYHLQQNNFTERLRTILNEFPKVDWSKLELEITETGILQHIDRVSTVIKECSDLGVSFSLDDFGTGYSSLTYFRALPVHQLKIDQSFIFDILDDPDDLTIVDGILNLAASFRR
ncbi:MAG: EAL domain-containing protein, partial [Leptonema sp. (in: Bacteria)]|nr:EAL domain-containing protein [Leptonema sp. (in: bacteria)]